MKDDLLYENKAAPQHALDMQQVIVYPIFSISNQ
jgi:hypothetical protein